MLAYRQTLSSLTAFLALLCAFRATALDTYDPVSGHLQIATVAIGAATYSNVVATIGGVVSGPAGTSIGTVDSYDPTDRQLTVPAVAVASTTYHNVVATLTGLVSIGGVSGADTYAASQLTIPYIQVGSTLYRGVVITVAHVLSVGNGPPASSWDYYNPISSQLYISVVAAGGAVYTNVSVLIGKVVSVGSVINFHSGSATMTAGRGSHTATLLQSGQVLVTGGTTSSGKNAAVLDTAELYDPVSGKFLPLQATMSTPRANHAAALLPNGRVLITGGYTNIPGSGDALGSAELYDPATQSFLPLSGGTPPAMVTPRGGHTATLLMTGEVLLAGGYDATDQTLGTAELYDPASNTFTPVAASLTTARNSHTATLLPNGRVLIAGGASSAGTLLASAEIFDPVAGTFTGISATMHTARASHTATALPSGMVLLAGGAQIVNGAFAVLASTQLFDPDGNVFLYIPSQMSTARGAHTATLLPGGVVLVSGGYIGQTAASLGTTETYY